MPDEENPFLPELPPDVTFLEASFSSGRRGCEVQASREVFAETKMQ